MKRFLQFALLLISAIVLLASCEKAPFITMTGPRTFNFTRDGGTQSVSFTCNRPWSVSSTESWIQITPSSGEASDKDITVTIKCSPNTTYDPRSATVTVKLEELSESITITQDTGIGLLVSPTTFELTNAAQVIEIEVQKNVQYSVAIDNESAKWIKQGGTKALTTDKVTFTISANESYDNREGKITFKQLDGDLSQTVTIRQSQTNGMFITTPDYNLSNESHTLSVEVKANVEFEVTSQAEWIKYVETKALTPSTITLSVEANESYDNRTGTVLVKQKNGDLTGAITVTQRQTDYLTVTPTSFEVDDTEQSVTIEVKDNVFYSVVIPDDAKGWISVSSNTQTKALVDDVVVLAIAANTTYGEREASITIKQTDGSLAETIKIKQAQNDGLFVAKNEYEVSNESQTINIEVNANVDYEASIDVDWIKRIETKALSSTNVSLSIEANTATTYRSGSVSIKQTNGNLSQSITIKQQPLPQVKTLDASEVKIKTAILNGSIVVESAKTITQEVFFRWSKTANNLEDLKTAGKKIITTLQDDGTFNWMMETDYSTTYYYISGAKVNDMEYYGEVKSFTTKELETGAVDLGLSVKWKGCNVGASKPEEYGNYYSWGEIETKSVYTWTYYKWCEGGALNMLTKYNKNSSYGTVDNLPVLEAEDDVAHVKLGENWRIPTDKEWRELYENCTKTSTVLNGVVGMFFTSEKNGNSIFLPAAGAKQGDSATLAGEYCFYWSSDYWDYRAVCTRFHGWTFEMDGYQRCYGLTVRPVSD